MSMDWKQWLPMMLLVIGSVLVATSVILVTWPEPEMPDLYPPEEPDLQSEPNPAVRQQMFNQYQDELDEYYEDWDNYNEDKDTYSLVIDLNVWFYRIGLIILIWGLVALVSQNHMIKSYD